MEKQNDYILEFKNVCKFFPGVKALDNISFNIEDGKITCILGINGVGKSTILNTLTNLLKPTSGDVIINGKIGYMFQKDHLLEWRSIMDNITLA